jgi:hypothetical protein
MAKFSIPFLPLVPINPMLLNPVSELMKFARFLESISRSML